MVTALSLTDKQETRIKSHYRPAFALTQIKKPIDVVKSVFILAVAKRPDWVVNRLLDNYQIVIL